MLALVTSRPYRPLLRRVFISSRAKISPMSLKDVVSTTCNHVFRDLGSGYCEGVYEKALVAELACAAPHVVCEAQKIVPIIFRRSDGRSVHLAGHFHRLDLCLVVPATPQAAEERGILELKAVPALKDDHFRQLARYVDDINDNEIQAFCVNFGQVLEIRALTKQRPDKQFKETTGSATNCNSPCTALKRKKNSERPS